jgi:hypothetical protein
VETKVYSDAERIAAPRRRAAPPTTIRRVTIGRAADPAERDADAMAAAALSRLMDTDQTPGFASAAGRIRRATGSGQAAAADPLGGTTASATHQRQIAAASSASASGSGAVLARMGQAFGADFGRVRLHTGPAVDVAADGLQARAFTLGRDVYVRRSEYRPSTTAGDELIAHELAHTLQQGAARSARRSTRVSSTRVQRVMKYGNDPQAMIQQDDQDLLYGINIPRGQTKGRLGADQQDSLRTIDDYNRAIGINAIMTAANSAIGLYDVRTELASAAAWALPPDQALHRPSTVDAIQMWIDQLRERRAHIGLEDLGAKTLIGPNKINRGGRFKKNRAESQAHLPKADQLTPEEIRRFLAAANTKTDAQNLYNAMSAPKQTALNKWIYRAFFRRTSKLGQEFAIVKLGARVHFNTVADPNYQPLLGPQWLDHGLRQMSKTGDNDKNRSITVSEYRKMKKLAKQYPASFNVYGEI